MQRLLSIALQGIRNELADPTSSNRQMSAIFGYGSLIFKPPPFPSLTSEPGYIKGFVRRFAQHSHDHRGTEEHPGRGELKSTLSVRLERELTLLLSLQSSRSVRPRIGLCIKRSGDAVPSRRLARRSLFSVS